MSDLDAAYQQGYTRGYNAGCVSERERVAKDMENLDRLRKEYVRLKELSDRAWHAHKNTDTYLEERDGDLDPKTCEYWRGILGWVVGALGEDEP